MWIEGIKSRQKARFVSPKKNVAQYGYQWLNKRRSIWYGLGFLDIIHIPERVSLTTEGDSREQRRLLRE